MSRLFGEKLESLRRQQSLTQAELVTQLGVASQAQVSNLEVGRREPALDLILRVADLFQVSVDYLIRDTIPREKVEIITNRVPPQARPPQRLGEKLHYLRTQHEISQRRLARQLGLQSRAYVSNIEAGRKLPSLDLIVRLANLFGVSTDYLVRDSISVQDTGWNPKAVDSENRQAGELPED